MSTTPAEALAAREAWQQLSIDDLPAIDVEAFLGVVGDLAPGSTFTVNDVRDRLDAAGTPSSARGGLFAGAVRAGLITPETVTVAGRRVEVFIPSTGESAHGARVRVYRRLP